MPRTPAPDRPHTVGISIDHFLLPCDRPAPGAVSALLAYVERWRVVFWPRTATDAPADDAMILQGRVYRQLLLWFGHPNQDHPDPVSAAIRGMEFLDFAPGPVPVAAVIEPMGDVWPEVEEVRRGLSVKNLRSDHK